MKKMITPALALLLFCSCGQNSTKQKGGLLVYNATVFTMDSAFSVAEAILIKDGKIMATGDTATLLRNYQPEERLDAGGKFIYPGFIDAHAHFAGYGNSLQVVDLTGTRNWEEVLQKCSIFFKDKTGNGEWIRGRGWDQNDWDNKEFPTKDQLDLLFPDQPVLLTRVDGHAAIANQKALDLAGIHPGDTISGGEIEEMEGSLSGILIDNAIGLVSSKIPAPSEAEQMKALKDAEKNCFAAGLTTVDDCGLSYKQVELIKKMQENAALKMRLYIMLSDDEENYEYAAQNGIIKTDRLNVRSFKLYGDGALGSRGACLLQPYHDKPGHSGFLLSQPGHFDSAASWISSKGWQMCTHAIGDSGNRTLLSIYAKYLKGRNDLRWRIEHAQVINQQDFSYFGDYSIIPSVQPTHATSDMYWAGARLGPEREKGAYAYKQLLQQNGWIPLGTDFPVEDISPLKTFFAAVFRKDASGYPNGGYQMENALSRQEALRGMTIWAARANFEENEKGSIEKGKAADFVILDTNLMEADATAVLKATVLMTFLGGEKVYEKKS